MKRKGQIIIGLALILIFILMALAAPVLAPNDPNATNLALKNAPPSAEYPLGCDQMGRCELSRLLYGARYCDVEQTVYGFDLDHANQILDEAGYVDTDGDGIREKDGVKLSAAFLYQTGTASDDNMVVYICDQASKIGIELTPQSAQMMDWYAMIQSGDYGLTIFKTQGGYYDPAMVITNINPSTSMDPILMQIGASQPELAALVDELDSATDEARIQEIYNTILTTMADQCLTTPLIYTRQLAIYSDAVASYTFPTDASFTSVQNIHLN